MDLIRNIQESESGIDGEVYFTLFGKSIQLFIEDDNIEYAKKCAIFLNELPKEVIIKLCEASIRYCNEFLVTVNEPKKSFNSVEEVLAIIYPSVLIVPYPEDSDEIIIHLELNCEWEIEHGMEWLLKGNNVLYVGAFNGEDPWSDYSKKESWNYA